MDYLDSFNNRAHSFVKAVNKYPNTLKDEIDTAINMLDLQQNDVLLNVFAGGFPIDEYIDKELNITYHAIDTHEDFISNSIKHFSFDKIPFPSNSINKIICLATLHHLSLDERNIIYSEFYRILVPGGMLVIGDVIHDSSQAKWLNEFVNNHNSNGHKGLFFTYSDTHFLQNQNFKVVWTLQHYNWYFSDDLSLIDFCKLLFGLDLCKDDEYLLYNIKTYLDYKDGCIPWSLIYFNATK